MVRRAASLGRRACAGLLALPFAACAAERAAPLAQPVWEELPGWQTEQVAAALPVLLATCRGAAAEALCARARALPGLDETRARDLLRTAFMPAAPQPVLFTGYFTITLPGSRAPSAAFPVPVLRPPPATTRADRAAIAGGALAGRGLELAWLRSSSELFFLQLQGSGRIALDDGGVLELVSAGNNGLPPIPSERLFAGANNDLSIPALRAWASANPAAAARLVGHDPSYVFFREGKARGATGVELAPLRSIAVDPRHFQLGSPVWIAAGRLCRLMVAHDTGTPIRGANRADIYFGAGPEAEDQGGRLYESGLAWQILPKQPDLLRF